MSSTFARCCVRLFLTVVLLLLPESTQALRLSPAGLRAASKPRIRAAMNSDSDDGAPDGSDEPAAVERISMNSDSDDGAPDGRDEPAAVEMDLNAAFAARLRDDAQKQEEERAQQKMLREAELAANGVNRRAWGYRNPGPEPDQLFEVSGIFAGVVLFLGPVFFFTFAGQDLNSC
eukprot:1591538-Prymnesium_polylepis.1